MDNWQQGLWVAGSSIILILGTIHLWYTLFTNKLNPRDIESTKAMNDGYPVLTARTTLWKAWIGFNCSHSSGAMYFGAINMYISIAHFQLIQSDIFIVILDLMMCLYYCWLAWKYWFRTPLMGVLGMTTCYFAAVVLSLIY